MSQTIEQRMKALGLDWSKVAPSQTVQTVDFSNAILVPAEVLARFSGKAPARGLGRHIAAQAKTNRKLRGVVVRTNKEDGNVYLVPTS